MSPGSVVRLYVPKRTNCDLVTSDTRFVDWFIAYNREDARIGFTDSAGESDIILLFEQYSYKTWNYAKTLEHSSLVRNHVERIYCVNYDSVGSGFLPGCYTSLTRSNYDPSLHRACCYPKRYNELAETYDVRDNRRTPTFLFSFVGKTRSYPLRAEIVRLLSSCPEGNICDVDVHFHRHTDEQKRSYVHSILDSWFVLCPRGSSPSSYRLFEAMGLGRCPVILSDAWVPVDGVDWRECSIRIAESDLAEVPRILKERLGDAPQLGRNAREAYESHFTHPMRYKSYLRAILDLHSAAREHGARDFESHRKRWRSLEFRRSNGWTVSQRGGQAVRALLGRG